MEFNPILTRESRARWRRQAFLLLFFGVAIFAVIMYFCYKESTTTWEYTPQGNYTVITREASAVGPVLFQQLSIFHVIGWMLLAPLLTATTIASERERGLLEALQLSQLTSGAIVRGKLYSALTFAGLIVLSLLPIIALCFLLGGVSPGEFLGAALQTFVAALLGISIGLWVSSRSRRAVQAVTNTVGLVIMWGLGTWIGVVMASFWPPTTWIDIRQGLVWLSLLNPGLTMASWLDINLMPPYGWTPLEPWLFGCLMQFALSLFLLWISARSIRKPFDEQYWVEIGAGTDVKDLTDANVRKEIKTGRKTKTHVPRARWELPIIKYINLANPIMQRDLRAKFIFRRAKLGSLVTTFIACLLAAGFYGWLLWVSYTNLTVIGIIWPSAAGGLLLIMILVPALIGANAFTRERESGTWEGIRLSLLSPAEIIIGKQIGAFAVAPLVSLLLVPFIYACFQAANAEKPEYAYYPDPPNVWQIAFTFILLNATAWVSAAWGLRISWASRKAASATGWTIGSLFIALVVAPILFAWILDEVLRYRENDGIIDFLVALHPYGAFAYLFEYNFDAKIATQLFRVSSGIGFFIVFGCVLLAILHERMRTNADKDDH